MQVGGTIPISLGVVKQIKEHNLPWVSNNNLTIALKNKQASIQGLKNQIGQLAKLISERPQGSMPRNTETNPREQLHAITVQNEKGDEVEVIQKEKKPVVKEYKPRVSYPNVTKRHYTNEQFGKFLKLLKKLHINLPFVEALSHMPNYVKFLKELLTNKQNLDGSSTMELNVVWSAILQNKLPNKLKDPWSFTVPCLIGSLNIDNALVDLGASINVMPYKMFKQLGPGRPKQTRMSIQLADGTIRYPRGVIEDVLVKIDKFIFPNDFAVLDMDKGSEVPLILGRPFLATARTIIDVGMSEFLLRRTHAKEKLKKHDEGPKQSHDEHVDGTSQFKVGGKVLLDKTNPQIATSKLDANGSNPFTIPNIFPYGTIELNSTRLKSYFDNRIDNEREELQLREPP
ncbi:Integrase, catalytic core [Gossypium australe]|uniref:Integrase, catalytic core n=1 Tax=Gossypium australe TaxID=47621 RepID=A0A5B6WEH8_9ROSI|nr:Integrase, catalytic core [Gossypium australe]